MAEKQPKKQVKKQTAKAPAKTTNTSAKKRGRPTKREIKQAEINRAWSIVMFAVGLCLTAMAFVPGEKFWAYLRTNFLFGVFGFSSYFIGAVIIYIGVLTATGKPVKRKMFWAGGFVVLLSSFVQIFFTGDVVGATFGEVVTELHLMGKTQLMSGGLTAGIIALPMVRFFGMAAAKITITILMVAFFMFLTDTTPYDIYIKTKEKAAREKEEIARQMEENRAARREKQRAREQAKAEKQKEAQQLQMQKQKKRRQIDFDVDDVPAKDVFADEDVDVPAQVARTFDDVKERKTAEQQKLEEIMKKLNMASRKTEEAAEKAKDNSSRLTQKALSDIEKAKGTAAKEEKAKNSLTAEEKAAIVPVSEIAPELAPEDKAYIYKHPPIDLFEKSEKTGINDSQSIYDSGLKLVETLNSFGVQTTILDINPGPAVTRYELQPLAGVKISKITNLADDIALNLAAGSVRIEAPIPGKAAVGIEVPNKARNSVNIRSIFESSDFRNAASPLTIALGMDIAGNVVTTDLTKMPHLLIAGSTGSGKSVCVNAIITSFLYKSSPEDVKLILIDPKVVELAEYNGIPHLMMPVVTEPKKAAGALGGAVAEMEKRYRLFAENSVRDIKSFNRLVANSGPDSELEKMPYIAVIIDELADLMMVAGKEVEDYICRLAQKARAAGIHLIVATQRPSVDVITGLIKANIPARIAFAVSSQVDSRTILDGGGAEKLLGMGDMLFLPLGASKPIRVQGTYVKDEEIAAVIEFIKRDFVAEYNQEMIDNMEKMAAKDKAAPSADNGGEQKDEMLTKAIEVVVDAGQASTSLLQRRLKLGYARAARIMDEMEAMGIIGPYEGSKPRQVLITKNQWLEMTLSQSE